MKSLYQRSNDQLLLQSTLFIVVHQKKINKNEMVKQITLSIKREKMKPCLTFYQHIRFYKVREELFDTIYLHFIYLKVGKFNRRWTTSLLGDAGNNGLM